MQKVKRTLFYYHLNFKFKEGFNSQDHTDEFFQKLISITKTKATIRYQNFGDRIILMKGLKGEDGFIMGRIHSVKSDVFPELMRLSTDTEREIESEEDEGIMETTHFIIKNTSEKCLLIFESNSQGPKIKQFVQYLLNLGNNQEMVDEVGFIPVVSDDLNKLRARINRCSEFTIKVHKDNIPKLKQVENNIYETLHLAEEHFDSEYSTLILKYDYKNKPNSKTSNIITNIINVLTQKPELSEIFNALSVKAEDTEKDDLLEVFDLLVNKIKSTVYVQKKPKFKSIVSEDIYFQMRNSIIHKNL